MAPKQVVGCNLRMNVAIDISPLESGHKVRGTGFYLTHLIKSLEEYTTIQFQFFNSLVSAAPHAEIIHYPYFDPFVSTLPVTKSAKTVVTVHDLTPRIFPKQFPTGIRGRIQWEKQKRRLQQVAAIITDSSCSQKDIHRLTNISNEKIHVVYLAAGEEFRPLTLTSMQVKQLRKKYRLPEKFILYVGDVTWNKNVAGLAEACLASKLPLVLVGKALASDDYDHTHPWNNDLVRVQELIKQHSNLLIPLGFLPTEDLVALYNIATAFAMLSHYEGFGLPILEAMQSGCPVITTKKGSIPEVAGDAAYYIETDNIKKIAEGLQEVFTSTVLQKELGVKGEAQAMKFSWRKTAEKTVKVYEEVY